MGERCKKTNNGRPDDERENFVPAGRTSVVSSPHLLLRHGSGETGQARVSDRSPVAERLRYLVPSATADLLHRLTELAPPWDAPGI
jgi:hypothetical protein